MKNISRRKFIAQAATGTAVFAFMPVTNVLGSGTDLVSWPEGAQNFRIHMIGHAHIDPVWLWPWSEGLAITHSTFRSNLDRMKETPDFCFVSSSALFYEWVAQNDPEMLKEIKKRVEEGRWNIMGGWWIEPDMNIPSGEAMVRQGLYGQLTFQKLLGKKATIATNPDSFGHVSTLPQIISKQGMDNYIFMRPGQHEKKLPADLFWWEGADGTKVLTYRIQMSYGDSGNVRKRLEQIVKDYGNQPMKSFMSYFGAGDHGGGATKENIRSINEIKNEKGAPQVLYSTPEKYFKEIRSDKKLNLPTVKDDLQHHAVGCYTAEAEIKKGNRQSEFALVAAEKIAAVGNMAWGAVYPKNELTRAWQKVLFLQFHDSLAGTSLVEHSQTAREGYGYALETAHQAATLAIQKLEWNIASEDPDSQYFLVFNPNVFDVDSVVEYDLNWGQQYHKSARVDDETGKEHAFQFTAASTETGSRRKLLVKTAVPSMGYRRMRLWDSPPEFGETGLKATAESIENEFLKVTFSKNGSVGIYDKKNEKECFAGGQSGCRAIVIDDPSDTWSHDIKTFANEVGAFGKAETILLESGPVRATIRVKSTWGNSELIIDWSLTMGSPELEAKVTLDWHEHLKMLKFSFPVNVENQVATYETPYGYIEREANGNEDPGQRWIDVTGNSAGKTFGVTVINDAKYGYSVHGNDIRVTVARSAVYAHHNPRVLDMSAEHNWMDQGIHTFKMVVAPHSGDWRSINSPRMAEKLTSPLQLIYQGIHGGKMAKSGSFLAVNQPNILISSVKQAENSTDLIVRCVETFNQETNAVIDLKFAGMSWKGSFKPLEIKTLRVNTKTKQVRIVNLLEE